MNELAALTFVVIGWLLSLPGCDSPQLTAPAPVVAFPFDWGAVADDDLLARMILSEAGGRVLTHDGQVDAAGIAWVALNRTRGLHPGFDYALGNLNAAITAPGQFHGISGAQPGAPSNRAVVADPESNSRWFGVQPHAGRIAYSIARVIARCVLGGRIPDPTHGALFFSDGRYARDESGNLLRFPDGNLVVEPWPDGRTHFRPWPESASYAITSRPDCCFPFRPAAPHALRHME